MRATLILTLTATLAWPQVRVPPEAEPSLVARFRVDPRDPALLGQLEKRIGEPSVLSGLMDAFFDFRATGATIEIANLPIPASLVVAATLLKRGVGEEVHFSEVAAYARIAIDADPPATLFAMDSNGVEPHGGRLDTEFASWCSTRGLQPDSCMKKILEYSFYLNLLVTSNDRRSLPLLREALRMRHPIFLSYATTGLARLNDVQSIPELIRTCVRVPSAAPLVGAAAVSFADKGVETVFSNCVKSDNDRSQLRRDWLTRTGPRSEAK